MFYSKNNSKIAIEVYNDRNRKGHSMKEIKIAYLGGGSKQWARVFMNDLTLSADLMGEIALYDIDKESALINQAIGQRFNKNPDARTTWNYVVYDHIEDALKKADFVVISILPGTFTEMNSDVHTPEKYGIYQSVGDTTGPGGVLRAMRTVPIFAYFAEVIRKWAPRAWVINFTNPMSICVKTLYDVYPEIKAFGCCHEVFHTQDFLCKVLLETKNISVSREQIYTDVAGINHFTWISEAKYQDIDIMQLLDAFIDRYYETGYNEKGDANEYQTNCFAYANRVKMDLYKKYRVLGAAGDRHLVEFVNNSWYLSSPAMVNDWKFALTKVDFRQARQLERIAESKLMAMGKKEVKLEKSTEEAVELMKAILGLTAKISNVNLPNYGQIEGFPLGAIVESNALFTHDTVKPVMTKPLPLAVKNLVLRNLLNQENVYEAIKERNLEKIYLSLKNDPLCSNVNDDEIRKMFVEMIRHTRGYLEQYFAIDDFLAR